MNRSLGVVAVAILLGWGTSPAHAAPIEISDLAGFLHVNGALVQLVDRTSPSFSSTLDPSNLGTFGWTVTNTGLSALDDVSFLVFLDADIDTAANTFFNEFGAFVNLSLLPSAPSGALAPTSWEIDEPGFLFGDIVDHLFDGELDNSNAVPAGAPDDVSLALGFVLGSLQPGATVDIRMLTSLANIGGLRQTDPDSDYSFYLNGYAAVTNPVAPIPEPSTLGLVALGAAVTARRARDRTRR